MAINPHAWHKSKRLEETDAGKDGTAMTKKWRPPNGMTGMAFMEHFCFRCERDAKYRETENGEDGCQILARTLMHAVDHPEYPDEWIIDERGPRCTAFVLESDPESYRCSETSDMFGNGDLE